MIAGTPDTPWGWFDRAAVCALDRISAELAASGLTTPLRLSRARRTFRHETLIVSETAESEARERLSAAVAGHGTPPSIALGAILHSCVELAPLVGRRPTRRLEISIRTLPPAAQTFLSVLKAQRRRDAMIG